MLRLARTGLFYKPASPLVVTHQASSTASSVYGASRTWSGLSIGTASADRHVVVAVSCITSYANNPFISAVTIGGNAATLDVANGAATHSTAFCAVARLLVTAGTTANVVVTLGGDFDSAALFGGVSVYTITGAAAISPKATAATDGAATSVLTGAISTAANGAIVAAVQTGFGSEPSTPSGWDQDASAQWGGSGGDWWKTYSRTTDGTSLTPNITSLGGAAGVAVSYEAA